MKKGKILAYAVGILIILVLIIAFGTQAGKDGFKQGLQSHTKQTEVNQ